MSDAELTDAGVLRLLTQRVYLQVEPVAARTLLRTAAQVGTALRLLDRVRHVLGIEDDDYPQA